MNVPSIHFTFLFLRPPNQIRLLSPGQPGCQIVSRWGGRVEDGLKVFADKIESLKISTKKDGAFVHLTELANPPLFVLSLFVLLFSVFPELCLSESGVNPTLATPQKAFSNSRIEGPHRKDNLIAHVSLSIIRRRPLRLLNLPAPIGQFNPLSIVRRRPEMLLNLPPSKGQLKPLYHLDSLQGFLKFPQGKKVKVRKKEKVRQLLVQFKPLYCM